MEKIIPLNFKRQDFEEIYFTNKQGNFLISPFVKKELIAFTIALLLLLSSTIYSLTTDKSAWLIVVLSIFSIILFIPYYHKLLQMLKWRKEVMEFLNRNEKFRIHKLVLTENSFSLIQDDNEDIHKWSAVTRVEIAGNYSILTGTAQYLFPKKSMSADDYDYLIQAIKSYVKNGL